MQPPVERAQLVSPVASATLSRALAALSTVLPEAWGGQLQSLQGGAAATPPSVAHASPGPSSVGAEPDDEAEGPALRKSLTTIDLTLMGIGGIIGAGIYVLTGQAAALYAGPAVVVSFIVSGVGCAFSALCYSELAAMIPVAGSAYSFASATLGQLVGFVIGWDLALEYLMGGATVAVGWSAYLQSLLGDMGAPLPGQLSSAPWAYDPSTDAWSVTGAWFNAPAAVVVCIMTALNVVGIQESIVANNIIVVIKGSASRLGIHGCMHA